MTKPNGVEIKELKVRMDYVEKGIEKAELQLNKRLETMNEFRGSLKDTQATFLSRGEYDAKHALIEKKIDINQQLLQIKIEALQKIVYIAVGSLAIIEIILRVVIK